MNDSVGTSVDLEAVRRDDEFLNALSVGGSVPPADRAEAELGSLLYSWRAETLAAPATPLALADVETAIAAQAAQTGGVAKRRSRMRHLRVASGAAAIAAVAAAGLLVLSGNSQPGDPLWNVKKVVFSEAAEQTEATVDAQTNLEQAEEALARGDVNEAKELVNSAEIRLRPVSDPEMRVRLDEWIRRLRGGGSTPLTATTTTTTTVTETTTTTTTTTPGIDALPPAESGPSTGETVTSTVTTTKPESSPTAPTTPTSPSSGSGSSSPSSSVSPTTSTVTATSTVTTTATSGTTRPSGVVSTTIGE